ncbi:MAG TPA: hypothetical protein VMZ28_09210 [Kofleriaceae bacterium]|nr:hypothetical protein [Kofleriaceae bacterium]
MASRSILVVLHAALFTAPACALRTEVDPPAQVTAVSPDQSPLPPFDPPEDGAEAMNTEYYLGSADEEAALFAAFARKIASIQDRQAGSHDQPVQRGFHAKAHGCLTGWLQLFPDRDPRTRFGAFADAPAGAWPLWARFSNGVGWQQGDRELDARGMAIKLMGVPGTKLIDEERGTQDFLMTNAPTPVGRDATDFMAFADANSRGKLPGFGFALTHPRHGANALMETGPIASMAAEQYWGGGAFHLGAHQAVKITARPCSFARKRDPDGSGPDRLRADLEAAARAGFCFNFYVQFQSDPFRTPIEDASREWLEADAPLVPVGRIVFPPQDITGEARAAMCKQLSYNPWHAIAAHQPMGHINRARRFVYSASRAHRKGGFEPTSFAVPEPAKK